MTKSKIFLFSCLAFIIGVALGSFFYLPPFPIYILALVSLLGVVFWPKKLIKVLLLMALFLFLGTLRYQLSLPKTDSSKIWFYNEQNISFVGVISKEPDKRIDNVKYTIDSQTLVIDEKLKEVAGKVLVTTNLYPEYEYGDKLKISCSLKKPERFEGFAYDRYLARYDIYTQCFYPEIEVLEKNQGNFILAKIFKIKNKLKSNINTNLSEPQASIFNAIILGVKKEIPQDLYEKFAISGVAHLIAISGLHIAIISAILMNIANLLYISRNRAFYLISGALLLYVILIGFPASAIRAAIMGWLVLLAMKVGRLNKATNALVFAGALMILINPKILRDDIGFQLSFLAVLGLIYFSGIFQRWLQKIPSVLGLKEAFALTLSAQIMILPIVAYNFGRLSLVAPLTNILILPFLPHLMVLAFIALAFGFFTSLFFWPVWLILNYFIKVVDWLSSFSWSAIEIESLWFGWVIVYYFLIIIIYRRLKARYEVLRR